jgi:hypothetical protein
VIRAHVEESPLLVHHRHSHRHDLTPALGHICGLDLPLVTAHHPAYWSAYPSHPSDLEVLILEG